VLHDPRLSLGDCYVSPHLITLVEVLTTENVRYIKPGVAQPDPHPNLDLARRGNQVWVSGGVAWTTPGSVWVIVTSPHT
jgi:hypothetical protein